MLEAEQLFARRAAPARKMIAHVAVRHEPHELVNRHIRQRKAARAPAVAQHRDARADPRQLLHAVRNIDDADAGGCDPANGFEEAIDFARRQRRGRLVHHEHARATEQRLRNLHHLLLGQAEAADETIGVEVDAGIVAQPLAIDPAGA